jgi:hypothetical protein
MGRAPVEPSITLQEERGPDGLSMDQVVKPEVLELVPKTVRRTILPPAVDCNQRGILLVPYTSLLGKGCSTPLNRLKEDQSKNKRSSPNSHT